MPSLEMKLAMAIVTLALAMGLLTIIVSRLSDRVIDLEEKLEEKDKVRVYKKIID